MLKAPFPWFGGKSRASELIWDRFGNVPNYIEPFFGSGAVLLERPHAAHTETINDLNCMVANFWRALQHDPEGVAFYADNPVNEADQHARHLWLCSQADFREMMKTDPEYYDSKIAGWWVWGQCIWIGAGWCAKQLPHLGTAGKGLNRQLPHLGDAGTVGVLEEVECVSDLTSGTPRQVHLLSGPGRGRGIHSGRGQQLLQYMRELSQRLRRTRVCCGDWTRILGPSVTFKHGVTGVLLDPPYADTAERTEDLYSADSVDVAHDVRDWAVTNGENPELRIALCGYDGEHAMPESWECVTWKAAGGYGSQGDNAARGNAARERIWFSPHCIRQVGLF